MNNIAFKGVDKDTSCAIPLYRERGKVKARRVRTRRITLSSRPPEPAEIGAVIVGRGRVRPALEVGLLDDNRREIVI